MGNLVMFPWTDKKKILLQATQLGTNDIQLH
jgi:hypothetical protein